MQAINFVNVEGIRRANEDANRVQETARWNYGIDCAIVDMIREDRRKKNDPNMSVEEAIVMAKIQKIVPHLGLTL